MFQKSESPKVRKLGGGPDPFFGQRPTTPPLVGHFKNSQRETPWTIPKSKIQKMSKCKFLCSCRYSVCLSVCLSVWLSVWLLDTPTVDLILFVLPSPLLL